ncbi:U6 snRNA-associated Sm-like protein LSm3 isoform X2 [Myotis daubentonii]|nr:U6 snRNA-associated Sm-like protein LSm3 isoform X2 [Myotis daubentonii]
MRNDRELRGRLHREWKGRRKGGGVRERNMDVRETHGLVASRTHPNQAGNKSTTQAYDQHLNMILGDVEETVTTIEIDEETYEEIYKSTKRNIPMLFVRGDGVVLVAPPLRVG